MTNRKPENPNRDDANTQLEKILTARSVTGSLKTDEPTLETYAALKKAEAFFNEKLFDGRLPSALITLDRTIHILKDFLTEEQLAKHQKDMMESTKNKVRQKASKTKFTCPSCKSNAWAKPASKIGCLAEGCNGVQMICQIQQQSLVE